jgi:hypothetical protein
MSNVTQTPKTLSDFIVGWIGALVAAASQAADFAYSHGAYILGICVTAYALYNQHMQAKINRKALKKIENEKD